jgi:phage baseplate assembly protein W
MNSILSDYNTPGYIASVVSSGIYRDVNTRFIHPVTGEVMISSDLDAIKNSIKNIILTPIGTRPFNPEFGTRISHLLFELGDAFTARAIKIEILSALEKWEKRIRNIRVQVSDNSEQNAYTITIGFTAQYEAEGELIFTLNRIR